MVILISSNYIVLYLLPRDYGIIIRHYMHIPHCRIAVLIANRFVPFFSEVNTRSEILAGSLLKYSDLNFG